MDPIVLQAIALQLLLLLTNWHRLLHKKARILAAIRYLYPLALMGVMWKGCCAGSGAGAGERGTAVNSCLRKM